MKNMCLEHLVLVNPLDFPSPEADARASGAQDVLQRALVVDSIERAVGDCPLVIGASARKRSGLWDPLLPSEAAGRVLQQAGSVPVALVFGRERSGLTAAELDRCTHLMHIPANPEYSSLNIAMAVQVLTYELRVQSLQQAKADVGQQDEQLPAASMAQMEGLFTHLEQALMDFGFLQPGRAGRIMQRLRRLFHRASPDEREVNILRGILSSAQGRKSMRDEPSRGADEP